NTASIYLNADYAATPENYKLFVVSGAKGSGGTDYTGTLTALTTVTPTYVPTNVSIAGTVYQDTNQNNVLDTGEPGIAGVQLSLSGTTAGGQAVTATTTTASNGTYSFATDSSGNNLVAGTYKVTESQPTAYYAGGNTVGTVNGTAAGTLLPGGAIGSITL